jgi:predicted NUDIX family NTP pyrophosphohydrolase
MENPASMLILVLSEKAMKHSAGILLYRFEEGQLLFLLVHPGGPFWSKRDEGAWTIPKGEMDEDEDPLAAARREFQEETGIPVSGHCIPLRPLKQKSGKIVHAWASNGDLDVAQLVSNTFEMQWPPKSGKLQSFPEIDKAGWFTAQEALVKILPGQQGFIHQLQELVDPNN